MNIRIGFIHRKEIIHIRPDGNYDAFSDDGEMIGTINSGTEYSIELIKSSPSEYDWYEKLDTVHEIGNLESHRQKYYLDGISTRVIKAGKKLGKTDNFEYWILQKTIDMDNKVYSVGDYKFKKVIRKKASGTFHFGGKKYKNRIIFIPKNKNCTFSVKDVDVGIGFHWDHKEDLCYSGCLEIIIDNTGNLTGINIIDIEDYLSSVNSSEMRNDNNIEMLKAQTVAARSTVLATMGKHHFNEGFDLCSDDHCQCYQGTGKVSELSALVTKATEGQILMFGSSVVDARYSKICGGITERYSSCWEDIDFPYLGSFFDKDGGKEITGVPSEFYIEKYIKNTDFECFCNTKTHQLPSSLEFCEDLFRWRRQITASEIRHNLMSKFGVNIGSIKNISVLKRGYSGRCVELELTGTEDIIVISKELNVRRLLSDSHLPSSAFILSKQGNNYSIQGAGWGHGVGMCQIGAQVMGETGHNYKEILKHYYRGCAIKTINRYGL